MPMRIVTPPGRRLWAVLVSLFLACISIQPAVAVETVRREVKHFFECLGLMIGNPAVHEDNCLPNRVPGPFGSIQSTGSGGVVAAPVVAPPPPPAAPPACACGACYAI